MPIHKRVVDYAEAHKLKTAFFLVVCGLTAYYELYQCGINRVFDQFEEDGADPEKIETMGSWRAESSDRIDS
jgi:hypothetical protein